jgi:diguanylate cyclase (GGDEF)-like protein/PAS domain S-box-containing protein
MVFVLILSYWMAGQVGYALGFVGFLGVVVSTLSYTTLIVLGVASLAGRKVKSTQHLNVMLGILACTALVLWVGKMRWAQTGVSTINTLVGLVATRWLWNVAGRRWSAERLVGPLLTLLGLTQLMPVMLSGGGLELQASVASVLRVALGVALLYAAWHRAEIESAGMRSRFELLTERSHQGVLIFSGTGIVYANPAALATYGVQRPDQLSMAVLSAPVPHEQRDHIAELIRGVLRGAAVQVRYEGARQFSGGSARWLSFDVFRTEWDGQPAAQVLITDDTERHDSAQALLHQALHDDLTGLPNRNALLQALRERCAGEAAAPFVLLLLDIDRFKLFNEAHGHAMGDEVIKALAQVLKSATAPGGVLMRTGEDEFALVSGPGGDQATALAMAARVRVLLAGPLKVAHREFFVDVSMGIAMFPNNAGDVESLLRAANAAMHMAKRTPGTSYTLAQQEFERGASNILDQEQALRTGLLNAEFHLAYQPKVDAQSTKLVGFEVLARWERPGIGPVAPVEFIAAAERTGLIGELGSFFLREACQQLANWQAEHSCCVPLAVNVSPLQLLDASFPQLVARVLAETGARPELLTLEITESSAVQNLEQTITQIEQLRDLGVQVAMDDFGAGFSSLNMLRSLPLHTVKIDRGLVDPLPAPYAVAVVRAICQLADALHLSVVAEGVETQAQAQCARDAGCTQLQGYLYSRPFDAVQAGRWLVAAGNVSQTVVA